MFRQAVFVDVGQQFDVKDDERYCRQRGVGDEKVLQSESGGRAGQSDQTVYWRVETKIQHNFRYDNVLAFIFSPDQNPVQIRLFFRWCTYVSTERDSENTEYNNWT